MTPGRLFTFGHSTRSEDETVTLLREFGVGTVVDVRSIRGSRHNPQFGAEVMPGWLADGGIDYDWIALLGGRRGKQPVDPDVNAGWTHDSFRRYADYALGDDFARGLATLEATAAAQPSAIMCAEAVPWRCHRSLISTAMVARGWQVTHLFGPGHSEDHVIGKWGAVPEIADDGRITYPAPQPSPPSGEVE